MPNPLCARSHEDADHSATRQRARGKPFPGRRRPINFSSFSAPLDLTTHERLLKLREHYFALALWETAQELEGYKDRVAILEHLRREVEAMLDSPEGSLLQ